MMGAAQLEPAAILSVADLALVFTWLGGRPVVVCLKDIKPASEVYSESALIAQLVRSQDRLS